MELPGEMSILIDEDTLVVVQGITRREGKVITKTGVTLEEAEVGWDPLRIVYGTWFQ